MAFEGVEKQDFDLFLIKSIKGGHWHWSGPKTTDGVPYLWFGKQAVRAYRIAWGLYKSDSIVDKTLRRACNDPECISPYHRECVEVGMHTRGARHGQAKLTETDIIDIREQYENGIKQAVLAAQRGVSQAQISMIVNRRMWKHVG